MALDHALVRRAARTGERVIRVYRWSRPTLSLGRNQPARGYFDPDRARELGIGIVRRPTGGRALLHDRELTYSVTVPAGDRPRAVYAAVNAMLVAALRRLGVEVSIIATGASAPSDAPCFDTPAAGELAYAGRKLAGSAQWREGAGLLQHGSILIDDDQGLIERLRSVPGLVTPAATLRAALGRAPGAEELADAFARTVGAVPLVDGALGAEARQLRALYDDDAWTWRR